MSKLAPPFVQNIIPTDFLSIPNEDHNFFMRSFTLTELDKSLKASANTAPGSDDIHYAMLYNLPYNCKVDLLKILNKAWKEGNFPEEWKNFTIIPLLKNDKNPKFGESYRPISLSSCILKTFERLIKHRLEWWMETNAKLPHSQYDFRKNRSTTDAQTQLVTDICMAFSENQTILGLFLDISGAYDNVQLPILFEKMAAVGLPPLFNHRIITLLSNRKISLRVNGSILDSKIAQIGLPQGSILSPILYTIYVADLEGSLPAGIKIIQYADDICLYVSKKNIALCQEALHEAMIAMDTWCDKNGLTISGSKSVLCPFNRKNRVDLPSELTLGRHSIPCDTKVRFLGLFLDRKLNWKWHISKIMEKTEKYLNVLRLICRNKWGADPSICLLFYRATIRSVIDYGSVFYGQARKTHLQKLDVIQNKSIRLSLGLLRSTPTNVILSEACELPLRFRRAILANKYLLKLRSVDSGILRRLNSLTTGVLTSLYWVKKVSPPLVDSFISTAQYQFKVYSHPKFPFSVSYDSLFLNIQSEFSPDYGGFPPSLVNSQFHADVSSKWPNGYVLYTDGSKIGDHVGCAFYDPQVNFSEALRLPDETSVFTAELVAIRQVFKYLRNLPNDMFIIVTDSKSGIMKLSNVTLSGKTNYLLLEIIDIHAELFISGKKVLLLWTAAHKGVKGNEEADRLAKLAATTGEQLLPLKVPASDLVRPTKQKVIEEWQSTYQQCQKGIFYKGIQPSAKRKPWFSNVNQPRSFFVNILRLRTNHFICGTYLHKIGLRDTPLCTDCDEPEDMEHVIMTCTRFSRQRNIMWAQLSKAVPMPFNYSALLQDVEAYPAIHNFLLTTEAQRR